MTVIRAEARFATGGDSQIRNREPENRNSEFELFSVSLETVPLDVNLPTGRGDNAPAFSCDPPISTWMGG